MAFSMGRIGVLVALVATTAVANQPAQAAADHPRWHGSIVYTRTFDDSADQINCTSAPTSKVSLSWDESETVTVAANAPTQAVTDDSGNYLVSQGVMTATLTYADNSTACADPSHPTENAHGTYSNTASPQPVEVWEAAKTKAPGQSNFLFVKSPTGGVPGTGILNAATTSTSWLPGFQIDVPDTDGDISGTYPATFAKNGGFLGVPRTYFGIINGPTGTTGDAAVTMTGAAVAPTANCDFYWARPGDRLEIPDFLGVLSNDTDPQHLALSAHVTKTSFGAASHNFSLKAANGSFSINPGRATKNLVITYFATNTDGNSSAPTTVTIKPSKSKPPLSTAGDCDAPQYGSAQFQGTPPGGTITTSPKKGDKTDAGFVCGKSRFRWWNVQGTEKILEKGSPRCVFMFSNQTSDALISAVNKSDYTVSELIVRVFGKTFAKMQAANVDPVGLYTAREAFSDFVADSLVTLDVKISSFSIEKARAFSTALDTAFEQFARLDKASGYYELAQLSGKFGKYFDSVATGSVDFAFIEGRPAGCFVLQLGPQDKKVRTSLGAVGNTDHVKKSQAYASVINSHHDFFNTSLLCGKNGKVTISTKRDTDKIFFTKWTLGATE